MNTEGSFGRLVRERRRLLDLTQEELARRVGCAAVTLRKIEADDLRPSQQIAERLAMSLGIPLEERASFVRLARSQHPDQAASTLPTPTPTPEEIGIEDLSGRAIRGYALGERIGAGGFGAVYRAMQPLVEREVAIKIILPQYANRPEFIRRFEAEAQLVARLEHPHIVPLYDYWREPSVAYLVMRLLRGGSVQALLQGSGPLPLERVARMLEQVGSALEAAHRAGIIHRDLKPANILLDEYDNAYLADFGIAKNLGNPNLDEQTRADEIIGSPSYFSPEQIRSETVKPQADIYSLGVVLYELLTGAKPFQGPTPIDLIQQHLTVPLPPLAAHRSGLPAVLDEIIARATAKNPLDRYTDVANMVADVRSVVAGGPLTILGEATTLPKLPEPENPYKGLRAFGEADALDFFGREALTQQLLARMAEGGDLSRFLAVVGPSGSGKSSVVKAGLIPALRRGGLPGSENWFIVDFTPGAHPFEELEAALLRIAIKPPESLLGQLCADKRGLLRAVRRCLPDDPGVELVLVIDQFEEVFTHLQDEATRSLLLDSLVTAALDERSRMHIVVTLRADFTDRPLNYVDFGELMRQRMEVVLPLTPDELEQAISGPARRAGLKLETGLDAAIIREVGDQPGALPLLQYALTELFAKREGRSLTRHTYAEIGGLLGALGRRAEEVFAHLDKAGQEFARQMFLRLVTLGEGTEDTRRRMLRSELENLMTNKGREITAHRSSSVVDVFGNARLLTFDRDPLTRGSTVEVAHEALLHAWKRLHDWIESSRADVRLQRQLASAAADWVAANREPSFLLTGARLAQFEGWAGTKAVALTHDETAFLTASSANRQQQQAEDFARQQRELESAQKLAQAEKQRADDQAHLAGQLRQRAVYLLVALILAGILAVTSFFLRQQALQKTDIAQSNELAASSISNLDVDPELSILLALQAIETSHTAGAEDALHRAVQASRIRYTLTGHTDEVNDVEFSSDGTKLASASSDHTAKIWDFTSGKELFTLKGHTDQVLQIRFSPNGKRVATASWDGTAKIWDVATGQALLTLSGHTGRLTDIKYSPDGKLLATVADDRMVKVWDAESGRELLTLADTSLGIVSFNPDGSKIALGYDDGTIKVWDIITKQAILTLSDGGDGPIYLVSFSPDGTKLVSNDYGDGIVVWNLQSGEQLATLNGYYPAFDPNGSLLATWTGVGGLAVYDASNYQKIYTFAGHAAGGNGTIFNQDGSLLATPNADGTIKILDMANGRELFTLSGHAGGVGDAAFSPGCVHPPESPFAQCGRYLATASRDKTIKIWDITPAGNREVITVPGNFSFFGTVDKRFITGTFNDDLTTITYHNWDMTTVGKEREASSFSVSHPARITDGANSPDSTMGGTVSIDGTVKILDLTTGEVTLTFKPPEPIESAVDVSILASGTRLTTISQNKALIVWDAMSRKKIATLPEFPGTVMVVSFSPDGNQMVVILEKNPTATLWNLGTGEKLFDLIGHTQPLYNSAFSPDGKRLATVGKDGTAILWDVQTGKRLLTVPGHSASVQVAVFSRNGSRLATGSVDGSVKVWDVSAGPTAGQELLNLSGYSPYIFTVDFSPDGRYLASGSFADGITRVYALQIEDLIAIARSRLTRTLTIEECQKYLHQTSCP